MVTLGPYPKIPFIGHASSDAIDSPINDRRITLNMLQKLHYYE